MQADKNITVEMVSSFAVPRDEWNALLQKSGYQSIFQTHEWIESWWKHFHEGKELFILCCRMEGALVGILPLMRFKWRPFKGAPGFNLLELIGTPDSDYDDFIIDEMIYSDVLNAGLKWLRGNKKLWHVLVLQEIPELSPINRLLKEICHTNRFSAFSRDQSICPQASLPSSYHDYEKSLSSNTRSITRRKNKKLAHADVVSCEKGAACDMQDFFVLYQDRWGAMAPQHKLFHEDVARKLDAHLNLFFVVFNGKKIAVQYCYDFGKRRCLYLSGFDSTYKQFSPGIVSLSMCIKDAIENNLVAFDFMRGNEKYKSHYANIVRVNKRYVVSHSFVLLVAYFLVRAVSDKTREFFKYKHWRKLYPWNFFRWIRGNKND